MFVLAKEKSRVDPDHELLITEAPSLITSCDYIAVRRLNLMKIRVSLCQETHTTPTFNNRFDGGTANDRLTKAPPKMRILFAMHNSEACWCQCMVLQQGDKISKQNHRHDIYVPVFKNVFIEESVQRTSNVNLQNAMCTKLFIPWPNQSK